MDFHGKEGNPEDQHKLTLVELCERYKCNHKTGLSTEERDKRPKNKDGDNVMTKGKTKEQLQEEAFWENALPNNTYVRINGEVIWTPNKKLVIGDLVILQEGDIVPADCRIVECYNLTVDMSRLIGERDPKRRSIVCTQDDQLMTENMLLAGSFVLTGSGTALVVATGDDSILGRTVGFNRDEEAYSSVKSLPKKAGHLLEDLKDVCKIWVKNPLILLNMNSLSYLLVPIHGVVSFLSKMEVANVYFDGKIQSISGGDNVVAEFKKADSFGALMRAAILVNTSKYDSVDKQMIITTNHYETAIFNWFLKYYEVEQFRQHHPIFVRTPFSKNGQFQFSIHKDLSTSRWLVTIEGAPEVIFGMCTHTMVHGKPVVIDEKARSTFNAALSNLTGWGHSVFAFAEMFLDEKQYPPDHIFNQNAVNTPLPGGKMCLVGMISLTNPLKDGIGSTLEKFMNKGIKLIFLSSDHPTTLRAIANQAKIHTEMIQLGEDREVVPKDCCLTGDQLSRYLPNQNPDFSDKLWSSSRNIIVGRAKSHQKLWVLEYLQKTGKKVGVIAKWSNDSESLKKSDLGIVLRGLGPHYMKENAHIIVADNRLSSLVEAMELVGKKKNLPSYFQT